jgi:hypothetical protein
VMSANEARLAALTAQRDSLNLIVGRYLDNHCANADAEGMSALCECQLCRDARAARAVVAAWVIRPKRRRRGR